MKKIGLALSGGGFRASLYHLGLIRFLRDGGILPQVTHITSVSGGSITAAHLVLNWDRYNGSAIAGFVLSLISMTPYAGIIIGILALVFSGTALSGMGRSGNPQGKGLATAGLIIGILGLIGQVGWIVAAANA